MGDPAKYATCETCPAWDDVNYQFGSCVLFAEPICRSGNKYCMQHPENRHLMEPPAKVDGSRLYCGGEVSERPRIAMCETCPAWVTNGCAEGLCKLSPSAANKLGTNYCMQHPGNLWMMTTPEPVGTVGETPEPIKAFSLRNRAFELMQRLLQAHTALLAADDCSVSKLEAISCDVGSICEAIEELAADAWEQGADGKQEADQ